MVHSKFRSFIVLTERADGFLFPHLRQAAALVAILSDFLLLEKNESKLIMSGKLIIIFLVDIFIFILLVKLILGGFKEFKKCIYYLIKPNIASIIDKDYDNDFNYTHKFLMITFLMVIIAFLEFYFFYNK